MFLTGDEGPQIEAHGALQRFIGSAKGVEEEEAGGHGGEQDHNTTEEDDGDVEAGWEDTEQVWEDWERERGRNQQVRENTDRAAEPQQHFWTLESEKA